MGWYDAFGGKPEKINMSTVTSDTGSAAKNFGDAFVNFGKNMREVESERVKQDFVNTQTTLKENELETKAEKWVQEEDNKDYLTQAFASANPDELKQNHPLDSTNSVDAETMQKATKHFQDKFNDEAIESSATGGYADMKAFMADDKNAELVKNADGATMLKIDKYFSDKSNNLKEIKHATAIQKMQAKVAKASKTGGGKDDSFKYTEVTDAKIASQVKTALGMDAPDFTFTDVTKKAYENAVAGSAAISKKYFLEPSLAIHVYQNPDLYEEKTATNGRKYIAPLKQKTKPKVVKKNSWKDYQN